jgi:Ca2+-binding EF-hand superfamily protein
MKFRSIALMVGACFSLSAFAMNHEGKPSAEQHKEMAKKKWQSVDTDKDGSVSKQEAEAAKMKGLVEHFDQFDSNKDGKISDEEMRAAHQQRHEKRPAMPAEKPSTP